MKTTELETAELPQLIPGRACGTCMMCCKVPAIEEFAKPPGVWCKHAVSGKGCGIYAERPGSCRAFYCLWMQDASFGPEWKPEKAKFVVYVQRNGVNLQVAVDPSFPNAWTKPPYQARIRQWVADGAERRGDLSDDGVQVERDHAPARAGQRAAPVDDFRESLMRRSIRARPRGLDL